MMTRRQVLSFSVAATGWHRNQLQRALSDCVQNRLPQHLPHPKFWFGQRVCWEWTSDDDLDPNCGKTYRDYGEVVGIVWQPPHYKDAGWVYWVNWVQVQSPTPQLPFVDAVSEGNLSVIEN